MATIILNADARAIPLPDRSVLCVITSPPYWGLRNYGHDSQIGLEKTPEAYVAAIVEVFREVWRVLRDDGTVWLNLGDSYAGSGRGGNPEAGTKQGTNRGSQTVGVLYGREHEDALVERTRIVEQKHILAARGVKSKDLIGIPWRVAFALQAAGWYLRSDIIWAKPNPMPESVTDRPTRSHEYVFLLTKRERYFYDAFAVREELSVRSLRENPARNRDDSARYAGGIQGTRKVYGLRNAVPDAGGRNQRSVWTITTKPYAGAHFATFPPDLVEPCLLAGTPIHSCADCGAPYRRIIERGAERREQQIACGSNNNGDYSGTAQKDYAAAQAQDPSAVKARILAGMVERRTVGWSPTCTCPDGMVAPAIVLDPFGGSGTVGIVASRHDRDAVIIDRKFDYCVLAAARQLDRRPVRERDKQSGHGRRHAGFNERYFGRPPA